VSFIDTGLLKIT